MTEEFIPVRCSNERCGAVIGRMMPKNGKVKLVMDSGWEIIEGDGPCPDCRKRFYFKPPLVTWEALVDRWMKVNGKALEMV